MLTSREPATENKECQSRERRRGPARAWSSCLSLVGSAAACMLRSARRRRPARPSVPDVGRRSRRPLPTSLPEHPRLSLAVCATLGSAKDEHADSGGHMIGRRCGPRGHTSTLLLLASNELRRNNGRRASWGLVCDSGLTWQAGDVCQTRSDGCKTSAHKCKPHRGRRSSGRYRNTRPSGQLLS